MRTVIPLVAFLLLLLGGCEQPADEPGRAPAEPDPAAEAPPPPGPEPFDTLAVVEEARALAGTIDAGTEGLTRRERAVDPAVPDGEPRRIILWDRGGLPARLRVDEFDDAGERSGSSTYYFDEAARLRYVLQPYARYVLDGEGHLLVWMDETGNVLHDISEEDRRARAARLTTEAREYLEELLIDRD